MNDDFGGAFDIGDQAPKAPATLANLQFSLEEATSLEEHIAQMEDDLKAAKKNLNYIKSQRIPDMMSELQMAATTYNGWKVSIHDFVSGSLPKEDEPREKAIEWITLHGGEDLIKTQVTTEFGRSGHNEAMSLAAELQEQGYNVSAKSGVHPQTLCAWVRERLKKGEEIDIDVVGVYTGKVAKFEKVRK